MERRGFFGSLAATLALLVVGEARDTHGEEWTQGWCNPVDETDVLQARIDRGEVITGEDVRLTRSVRIRNGGGFVGCTIRLAAGASVLCDMKNDRGFLVQNYLIGTGEGHRGLVRENCA